MISRNVALCAATAALLAACSTLDRYTGQVRRNNTATGALMGAVGGAALGYATNTNKSEEGRTNALIGAGIGALAGAGIGRYMDRQEAELQHHLAGSGVGVIRQGENIVLQMPGDVTFALDSAAIQPRFDPVLDDVAAVLNRYPATYVDIVGHASADGSDAHNQVLSERRALAVGDYLLSHKVLRARLFVAGRGESEPIASNATQQGRAQNRRVEIILRPHTTT
ncbi:OmpA family protein [Caulobacter sp. 17J80-11]|uniref:OmpA family protein n=1 Tax=Caulobacter sp. 17J80-11 TaxID=2763502 RepID=UPI001653A9A0|nr:OmpA family protein [Caulobacter sp. 17J80-11]MBC6983654.1 OmpA family protein [Caulobacter sp. 17J80-11]